MTQSDVVLFFKNVDGILECGNDAEAALRKALDLLKNSFDLDALFINYMHETSLDGTLVLCGNESELLKQVAKDTQHNFKMVIENISTSKNFPYSKMKADELGYTRFVKIFLELKNGKKLTLAFFGKNSSKIDSFSIEIAELFCNRISHFLQSAKNEEILQKQKMEIQHLITIFETSEESILITDKESKILFFNQAFEKMTGYRKDEVRGKTPRILKSKSHSKEFYVEIWENIKKYGYWSGEIWNRRKDGSLYIQKQTIKALLGRDGAIERYFSVAQDITNLKEQEDRIRLLSYYDVLTSLPNKFLFNDRLIHSIEKSKRHDTKTVVLLLDIDRFQHINDALGHDVGDELLRNIAKRISSVTRAQDTVARLGGDEFAFVLEDSNANEASHVANRILEVIKVPIFIGGTNVEVSGSIGIAIHPDDGLDHPTLIKNCDMAMYASKQGGRNRFSFYNSDMNDKLEKKLKMEMDLREAIERDKLELYFQPLVNIKTLETYGVEALLRWDREGEGFVSPEVFIPLAEECGLIEKIDKWVLDRAFEKLRKWEDEGEVSLKINVNVSAHQFKDEDIVNNMMFLAKKYGVSQKRVVLELTESTIMENPEYAIKIISMLKKIGVSVVLDDFGTGHSSLSYLRQMPFDAIKIDRSFIMDCPKNKDSIELVNTMISMTKALKISIVAEGVETDEQLKLLKDFECSSAQGYLFSRPLSEHLFFEWIRNRDGEKL